jgi:hypothetical protein
MRQFVMSLFEDDKLSLLLRSLNILRGGLTGRKNKLSIRNQTVNYEEVKEREYATNIG